MKKLLIIAALISFVSCESLREEFQPVFWTGKYPNPEQQLEQKAPAKTHNIADLASLYLKGGSKPFTVKEHIVIQGVVSTTDQPGNFYKSFFIQDDTGGIEIKIGKNGLYNDYLPGQTITVDCMDLTIGSYGTKTGNYGGMGMVQVGYNDPSGSYETSYLEVPLLIDCHIYKGKIGNKVEPKVLFEDDFPKANDTQASNSNIGKLVTIRDLTYGGKEDDAFVLLYIDSNKDKKASSNRIFVSGKGKGITTWAMSKEKMTEYLNSGIWDDISIGNSGDYNYGKVSGLKGTDGSYAIEKNAYSVSQYFRSPSGTEIQLRTSGYSKFSDNQIPKAVLEGRKKVDITGILNLYQGGIQMVVNDITDIVVHD